MPHNHQTHPSWRRDRNLYLKAKGNNFPILGMEIKTRTIIACCGFSALQHPTCLNSSHGMLTCPMLVSLQSRAEPRRERGWWAQTCTLEGQRAGEQRGGFLQHYRNRELWHGKGPRWRRTAKSPREQLHGATCMDSAILGDREPLPAAETDPWQLPTHCRHWRVKHNINFLVIDYPRQGISFI